MPEEVKILKAIYALVSALLYINIIWILIRILVIIIDNIKNNKKQMSKNINDQLENLFMRDQIDELIIAAQKICGENGLRKNDPYALFWLVRAYHVKQESTSAKIVLDKIKRVNPEAQSGYAKWYYDYYDK